MSKTRPVFLLQIVSFLALAGLIFWLARQFPLLDWIERSEEWMRDRGWQGLLFYPLVYAVCNLLLLPGGILALGAGYFFGVWKGFFVILAGNVIGAAGSFLISRTTARAWIRKRFEGSPRLMALDRAIQREGWRVVFLSMLHPLFPTSLIKYFFGLTPLSLRSTLLWVAIGQAPGVFLYVYLGSLGQKGMDLWRGVTQPTTQDFVIWGIGLSLSVGVLYGLGRVAIRVFREVGAAVPDPQVDKQKGTGSGQFDQK